MYFAKIKIWLSASTIDVEAQFGNIARPTKISLKMIIVNADGKECTIKVTSVAGVVSA
jgi:hypothetical protein